ncbi:MAG: Na/Pi symporter [Acidibacillus sp.]|uniref:Na/Pi cotransporter n=1 Tax=Sulfoacidibacillus ferrooxidans TaxID=2005001 RepID=A0A9X1V5X1_9BACL|nr:Na/Pi symporter [Sulfoacidibacillus ferrooxidans]MCI0181889.1 hypothetical protein [Sulfoacidibacillus ferrooxidans]MCY0892814.1 Na/Pi symporter [Acidibacillus sp.]
MSYSIMKTAVLIVIGLCVFIVGLLTMRHGLAQATSKKMELLIARLVKTPTRGLLTGIIATLFTQSSAAVTIISMGLVAADVLQFTDTIGIILGTNIGSTFTVGLLSLDVARFGPYVILLGVILYLLSQTLQKSQATRDRLKYLAIGIIGFGTLFVGFHLMTAAATPLVSLPIFAHWLLLAKIHPILGLLTGTLITAMIGSSSATTALTLTLAKTGMLSLLGATAIVFGNNIGTCTTAILASIGGTKPVQRVAATHVFLNVTGATLFMLFLHPFVVAIQELSGDIGTQVALAHFLFNVISSLLALPFVAQIVWLLEKWMPDRLESK